MSPEETPEITPEEREWLDETVPVIITYTRDEWTQIAGMLTATASFARIKGVVSGNEMPEGVKRQVQYAEELADTIARACAA